MMRLRQPTFFLIGVLLCLPAGCRPQPRVLNPAERAFADLFVATYRLHQQYAEHPDSLALARKALFLRHNTRSEDLERFIAAREKDPETWQPILEYIQAQLGEAVSPGTLLRSKKERPPPASKP